MSVLMSLLPLAASFVALAGALLVSTNQLKESATGRIEARKDALDHERRKNYVDLLTSGRRLRDIPLRHFQGTPQMTDPDPIIVDMYRALYSIKITAPKDVADLAQHFHDSAIAFWRLSRDEPDAPSEQWQGVRAEVKDSVQRFRSALRSEFGESAGEDLGRLDYA